MSVKDLNKAIEIMVKEYKDTVLTYEKLIKIFPKAPSGANVKKLIALIQLYNVTLITSQEQAKRMNAEELKKREPKTYFNENGYVVSKKVTNAINIPVIGIGAGSDVDGQVLVTHDLVGLSTEFNPRFLRRYLNLSDDITSAVQNYVADVKSKNFPNEKEQY